MKNINDYTAVTVGKSLENQIQRFQSIDRLAAIEVHNVFVKAFIYYRRNVSFP